MVVPVQQTLRAAQHGRADGRLPRGRAAFVAEVRALLAAAHQKHQLGAQGGRAEGAGRLRLQQSAAEVAAAQLRACRWRSAEINRLSALLLKGARSSRVSSPSKQTSTPGPDCIGRLPSRSFFPLVGVVSESFIPDAPVCHVLLTFTHLASR